MKITTATTHIAWPGSLGALVRHRGTALDAPHDSASGSRPV